MALRSALSEETVEKALEMCGKTSAETAAVFGIDEEFTANILKKRLPAAKVGTSDDFGKEKYGFLWFNGITAPDGVTRQLERIAASLSPSGTAVFRTLCWLIDPSPDTKIYVEREYGRPIQLAEAVRLAKEQGFKIKDFYIAPKTDWTKNLFEDKKAALSVGENPDKDAASRLERETYMFELHSEEYSYVYFVLCR